MSAKDKWEFYQDRRKEFRWRRIAPNGNIVGASTEGYKLEEDCIANARRMGMIDTTSLSKSKSKLVSPEPTLSKLK